MLLIGLPPDDLFLLSLDTQTIMDVTFVLG